MGMLIVLLIVAIFLGTIIYSWMEGKPNDSPSSKELLERIKCSDIKRIDFRIRGIAFLPEESRHTVFNLIAGDTLYLRREPWNPVDVNAVAVFKGDKKIGYVEKPINKSVLKYISSTFIYNCVFAYKEKGVEGYMEYVCAFFIEKKGCNDKIPEGISMPAKDNILINPQLDFPLGRDNYSFYATPGEWIPVNWNLYGKSTRYETMEDPDTQELFSANAELMQSFLEDLYLFDERIYKIEEAIARHREKSKNDILNAMIDEYLKTHDITY